MEKYNCVFFVDLLEKYFENLAAMKGLIICCIVFLSLAFAQDAQAFIFSFGGEKIKVVEDMPASDDYQTPTGGHADACVIYKQFWILWVPLWNWDARYCLSAPGSDTFYEFADSSDEADIKAKHGSPSSSIPFWDKLGGKLVVAAVLFFWIGRGSSEDEEDSFEEE